MKRNKLKNLFIPVVSSTLVATVIPTLVSLTSCKTNNNTNNEEIAESTENEENSAYTIVEFAPIDGDQDVVFYGAKTVKAKVGRQFCTIKTPKATKLGQKFSYWARKDGDSYVQIENNYIIPKNGLTVYPVFESVLSLSNCVGFAAIETTTITFEVESEGSYTPNVKWTTNYGEEWVDVSDDNTIDLQPGGNVFFKGDNAEGLNIDENNYCHFTFSTDGAVNLGGNVMGLLDDADGTISDIPNEYCFYHLFQGGTAIKYISDTFLPSTNLQSHCYEGMFYGCTSILSSPSLPATALSPEANAVNNCYDSMFSGCTSLNFVKIDYDGEFPNSNFTNWLESVPAGGEIVFKGTVPADESRDASSIPLNWDVLRPTTGIVVTSEETIPSTGLVVNHPYQLKATITGQEGQASKHVTWVSSDARIAQVNPETGVVTGISPTTGDQQVEITCKSTDGSGVSGSIKFKVRAINLSDCAQINVIEKTAVTWDYIGEGTAPEFKYSTDGKAWLKLWPGSTVTLDKGKIYYLKGNNMGGLSAETKDAYAHFSFTKPTGATNDPQVSLGGNIMGLVDDGRKEKTSIPTKYCFNKLFSNNTAITTVSPDFLPSSDLTEGCYANLFNGCTKLNFTTTAKLKLPATKLADYCYQSMFNGCTSLKNIPDLGTPTLAKYCYQYMFASCTSLTASPALPTATPAEGCYYCMFDGCSSIASIGKIGLTTLDGADWCCFQMFAEIARAGFYFHEQASSTTSAFWHCPTYTDDPDTPTHFYVYNMFWFQGMYTSDLDTPTSGRYLYTSSRRN